MVFPEIVWDNATPVVLPSAVAAQPATVVLTSAMISGLTNTQLLQVSIDGAAAVPAQLTTVSLAGITSVLDALDGSSFTAATTSITGITSSSGAGSSLSIATTGTPAVLVIDDADHLGIAAGDTIDVYIDGAITPEVVTASGPTADDLAADLDALSGITAAATASVDTTVEVDVTDAEAADGVSFSLTIGGAVVDALDISGLADGDALAAAIQTALRAADAGRTDISAAWSTDVLTITDTRGREASGLTLTDSGGAIDASPTITNGSEAYVTVTTVSKTATSSVKVGHYGPATGTDGTVIVSGVGAAAVTGLDCHFDAINVGVAGDVIVDTRNGDTAVTLKLPVGIHKIGINHIYTTGTTATNLTGLSS